MRACAGQHGPGGGRALGGSECGWKGSRVGDPKRGRASERDQGHRGLRVPLCVSQACGSGLEPPGTHRNAASLGCPGRPLFHKEVAARKKRGAEICLAQHEPQTKANLSDLLQPGGQIRGLLGFGGDLKMGVWECERVRRGSQIRKGVLGVGLASWEHWTESWASEDGSGRGRPRSRKVG